MPDNDRYDEHLRERETQTYASTRLWHPRSHLIGLRGERALAEFFGAQQDLTNKPMGDGGVDIWIALRCTNGVEWFKVDAKGSTYGDYLRVDCSKIKPETIYVLVHISDVDKCVGWRRGSALMKEPPINWCDNGVFVHALYLDQLRDMSELKERFVGWRHDNVTEDGPFLHYCHCGKWGPFGYGVNLRAGQPGVWYCREHRPNDPAPANP